MNLIISAFYFYIPPALANSATNLARFIPFFKDIELPVDLKIKYGNKRLIGEHKQLGGLLLGILVGTLAGIVKFGFVDQYMVEYRILQLTYGENLVLYFLMSVFALLGDLSKSVVKRSLRIKPHRPFMPFDQIDHSLMSMLFVRYYYNIDWTLVMAVVITYFFLHIAANFLGFKTGIKNVPF